MLSDGQARPNATADVSATAKPAPEPRDTKDNTAQPTKPVAGAKRVSAAASDEALAKEALEGLKRIRAKARLDKMAIPKPVPTVIKPAVIVAKPPPPRPTWVAPLATLAGPRRPVRHGLRRSRHWRSPPCSWCAPAPA